jgi:hypothetical protein
MVFVLLIGPTTQSAIATEHFALVIVYPVCHQNDKRDMMEAFAKSGVLIAMRRIGRRLIL